MDKDLVLNKRLTVSQQAFVDEMAAGADESVAVIKAGYKNHQPSAEAWRLLQQPAIVAAIQFAVAKRLAVGSGIAVRVLQDFLMDEKLDKRLRVVCAKTLLDRAGHIAPKATAPGASGETPLNEMTMGQLRELADKLESELATRAKPVSSAKAAPNNVQTLDDIM